MTVRMMHLGDRDLLHMNGVKHLGRWQCWSSGPRFFALWAQNDTVVVALARP